MHARECALRARVCVAGSICFEKDTLRVRWLPFSVKIIWWLIAIGMGPTPSALGEGLTSVGWHPTAECSPARVGKERKGSGVVLARWLECLSGCPAHSARPPGATAWLGVGRPAPRPRGQRRMGTFCVAAGNQLAFSVAVSVDGMHSGALRCLLAVSGCVCVRIVKLMPHASSGVF